MLYQYIHAYIWMLVCVHAYVFVYVYGCLSSTLPEIDPDTAYVVCISVSLGFPYMLSVFFLIWLYSQLFWAWRCYGPLWTLPCHKDRYCDVTMI